MQLHRARGARGRRVEAGGQRLEVEHDRGERRAGGGRVHGRDGCDRLAAIPDPLARQRELVLRDRDDAVRDGAVVTSHHGDDPGQGARRGDVDAADACVRERAAQDRAYVRAARGEVRGVARAAGDLLHAVDQRLAQAHAGEGTTRSGLGRLHRVASAAAWTDSMIFT